MKKVYALALGTLTAALLLVGFGSRSAWGQQASSKSADDAKCTLPADVHPETYSRITIPKREDLKTDEERSAWDRRLQQDPHELDNPDHFQGTSHRMYLPVIGEMTRNTLFWLRAADDLTEHDKVLVQNTATRESGNQIEYSTHPKYLTPEEVEVIKDKKEPMGLPEKDVTIIHLVRQMIHGPAVDSKTYADAHRLFGDRGVLTIVYFSTYYASNAMLFRTYDVVLPHCEPLKYPVE